MSGDSSQKPRQRWAFCFAIGYLLHKAKRNQNFLGAGQKNLKTLKKPEIGHYLKHGLPPKECLFEFPVSKECLLPTGTPNISKL